MDLYQEIVQLFQALDEVVAFSLGGSRASGYMDNYSDYDCYVYYQKKIPLEVRRKILEPRCSYLEIGNTFFEEEDDCVLKNGIDIELIYRDISTFTNEVNKVYEQNQVSLGYTTCYLFNLKHSLSVFDKRGLLCSIQKTIDSYPPILQKEIISINLKMLNGTIPSYDRQILKAKLRKDQVSVNHRIAAYLASYFDVIYAMNGLYHPGEKRMIRYAKDHCKTLPLYFSTNISHLLKQENLEKTMNEMVLELKKCCQDLGLL